MVSPGLAYYIAFVTPAAFSFLGSVGVIGTYVYFPQLRSGAVYKHIVCLHIADIIQCVSWFIGPKFSSLGWPQDVCLTQEYIFQYGSLCKCLWVCAISMLTYQSLMAMQLTEGRFIKKALICFGLPMPVVAVSAVYSTGNLFCGDTFRSSIAHDREKAYLICYIGAIYLSILANLFVIFLIYSKISSLYGSPFARGAAGDTNKTKLLSMCRILVLYPILCSLSWAPEVCFLFAKDLILGIFTGVSVNFSGAVFAIIFFSTNRKAKKCWGDYISSKVFTAKSRMGFSTTTNNLTGVPSTWDGTGGKSTELSRGSYAFSMSSAVNQSVVDENVMHFGGRNFSADSYQAQKNPLNNIPG